MDLNKAMEFLYFIMVMYLKEIGKMIKYMEDAV